MRGSFFICRILALLLTLSVGLLPETSYGLRPGIEGKTKAGLEEKLQPTQHFPLGQPLDDPDMDRDEIEPFIGGMRVFQNAAAAGLEEPDRSARRVNDFTGQLRKELGEFYDLSSVEALPATLGAALHNLDVAPGTLRTQRKDRLIQTQDFLRLAREALWQLLREVKLEPLVQADVRWRERRQDLIHLLQRRIKELDQIIKDFQPIRLYAPAGLSAGLEEVGLGELPSAGQQEQPLRFIVDTSRGKPEVLRLLQLAVLLEKEKGLWVQAAGVATTEQLAVALDQLPDETSRLLLESRVFKYVPGDAQRYRNAMEKAQKLVPKLHPEAVITEINHLTVGWYLETIELLGIWKLSSQFKKQIDSYLTAA